MTTEFIFDDISEEEYLAAGSKWVTFPAGARVGDSVFLDIEIGMIDWDTPGKSMKVPVKVTEEGVDKGKEDKISFGVDKKGLWKGREIYRAMTGSEMPMKKGADGQNHPSLDPMALVGKSAVGQWVLQEGHKRGDPSGEKTIYPKLVSILPPGNKPKVENLGI